MRERDLLLTADFGEGRGGKRLLKRGKGGSRETSFEAVVVFNICGDRRWGEWQRRYEIVLFIFFII